MDCISLQPPVHFAATPAPPCQAKLVHDLKNKHIPREEFRQRLSSAWLSLWTCPPVSVRCLLPDASCDHWLSITPISPSTPRGWLFGEELARFILVHIPGAPP